MPTRRGEVRPSAGSNSISPLEEAISLHVVGGARALTLKTKLARTLESYSNREITSRFRLHSNHLPASA
jgi:hypothetical protein